MIADIIAHFLPNLWPEAKATSQTECQHGGLLLPRAELCAPLADQPKIAQVPQATTARNRVIRSKVCA